VTGAAVDPVDPLDLEVACRTAVAIAEAAGALLIGRLVTGVEIQHKGDHGDVVTDLDLAAEELIVSRLRAAFPGHQIVAEESGVHAAIGAPSEWTWLVDPLDGTNNVAVGLPAFVVGLALCAGRQTVVGVVHDPVVRRTWSAVRNGGAHGPGGRLWPQSRPTPHGPTLAWTQGHAVPKADATALALKLVLERNSYRTLQLWAPLVCWMMLARGDIDGFVGYRAEAVDLPAGCLIASEAGVRVLSLDGSPFSETDPEAGRRSFVAGRPDRLEELLGLVRSAQRLTPAVTALWP